MRILVFAVSITPTSRTLYYNGSAVQTKYTQLYATDNDDAKGSGNKWRTIF